MESISRHTPATPEQIDTTLAEEPPVVAQDILLTTINARYIHASLGLRCLLANMGSLQSRTRLIEFTLSQRPEDIAESLLGNNPCIIGFGVYIWNVTETLEVMKLIRILRPDIVLVIGGPEVSHEIGEQGITRLADHVVTGPADLAFADLCEQVLDTAIKPPGIVSPLPLKLSELASPYRHYDNEDVTHRVVYVEASRGCPFKCEFCLSSLDKTAVAFELAAFLVELQDLMDRGARQFKFVDRTFNLKADTSRQILEFFLGHIDKGLFLHFELIPDRLPDALRDLLPLFPPGSLQFEIGIQSFNPDVQLLISRKQNHQRTCENLRWLRANTTAHIHADLIFGLPGEGLASFGKGFDLLYELGPQEIQVGILKRLRGTPIARHTQTYDMRYMSSPPYRVLSTRDAGFDTVQRMVRFARYWDLIGNSGRFPTSLPIILGDQPFQRFLSLSDWLFEETGQTHRIALPKLMERLWQAMITTLEVDLSTASEVIEQDHQHNQLKGRPMFLNTNASASIPGTSDNVINDPELTPAVLASKGQRQKRHLSTTRP